MISEIDNTEQNRRLFSIIKYTEIPIHESSTIFIKNLIKKTFPSTYTFESKKDTTQPNGRLVLFNLMNTRVVIYTKIPPQFYPADRVIVCCGKIHYYHNMKDIIIILNKLKYYTASQGQSE